MLLLIFLLLSQLRSAMNDGMLNTDVHYAYNFLAYLQPVIVTALGKKQRIWWAWQNVHDLFTWSCACDFVLILS